jgi:hypothetical protein
VRRISSASQFDNIAEFLGAVAMHVCEDNSKSDENINVNQAIVGALTKALWYNRQITEYEDLDGQDWGDLSLHFHGQATPWYFNRREALKSSRPNVSDGPCVYLVGPSTLLCRRTGLLMY